MLYFSRLKIRNRLLPDTPLIHTVFNDALHSSFFLNPSPSFYPSLTFSYPALPRI